MAELTNKLHVKSGSTVYDCTCYTTTDEATPKTVSNGSYWEIKNNNTVCYLGLVPSASAGKTGFDTPLKVKKNNTEYIVQTKVVNYFTVTITQSANQTITVTCGGKDYTSTFSALAGSQYTVKVTPNTGYTAGTPNVTSGYVNSNISISASAATKATYVFTINKTSNQTITVTYGGTTYKSTASANTTFTATYGEKWTATIAGATGYNPGTLSATSGTITGNVTISATAATIKTFTLSFGATTNQTYVATIGGTAKAATSSATSYTVNYGTSYSVVYTAASASAAYTYTASSSVSGTVTSNVSVPAKSATATLRYYTLSIGKTTNQSYTLTLTKSSTYGGTLPSYTSTATKSAQNNLSVPYGTTYSITYTGDTGYNGGSTKSGTVNAATTVSHNEAGLKYLTLSIGETTDQSYTLTLTTNSTYGGTLPSYTSTATSAAQSLSVPYGTTYSISYTANAATAQYTYTASGAVSGTVTAATSIPEKSATATTRNYTLTLNAVANGYWQVNGVTKAAGSYSYPYGTSLKVECFANDGYVKPTQLTMS